MVVTILRNIIAITVVAALVGCASSTKKNSADKQSSEAQTARLTSDFSRSKLIAADFVATMTQFPSTNPATTVLHTSRPTTRFGELLLGALQAAGFDLRIGSESSDLWLNYAASVEKEPSDTGNPVYTFIVAAGEIKLKRSYEVDQHGIWPAGNMFVRGADASNVVMDDSIFSNAKPPAQPIQKTPVEQSITIARQQPEEKTLTEAVTVEAVPTPQPLVRTKKMVPTDNTASVSKKSAGDYSEFTNMYENGRSRYAEIFNNYTVVDSKILVFPNDSLVLGKTNKQSIQKQLSNFNPETDIISVIGCSHGASKIENGNAYLANGRAFRVKEEYVSAGLSGDLVLEEGCWANVKFAKLPDRGVVIQHKRLIN